jgi:hypothetical protein
MFAVSRHVSEIEMSMAILRQSQRNMSIREFNLSPAFHLPDGA